MDAREQALAINFIKGVHPKYNNEYLVHLRNCKLQGNDYYPKMLAEAYNTLSRLGVHGTAMSAGLDGDEGVAFVNQGQDGKSKKKIKCFNCRKEGHYANQCTHPSKADGDEESDAQDNEDKGTAICMTSDKSQHNTSHTNAASAFSFSQAKTSIPRQWILLDNQSKIDLFCNPELLANVRVSTSSMKVNCNAGSQVTNLVGDLRGYRPFWYDLYGIANILSFKRVREKYEVQYESNE